MDQVTFAKTYPRVAERALSLGKAYKAEYTMSETILLLGQSGAWVRKMVTGYRGKDVRAAQLLKARKTESGWLIAVEAIEVKLGEIYEEQDRKADRFAHPEKYLEAERGNGTGRAVKAVKRIAQEAGLTPEQMTLLDQLVAKLSSQSQK
jgi:hypothetical protein